MDLNVPNLIIFYDKNKENNAKLFHMLGERYHVISSSNIFTWKSTSSSFVSVILFKEDKIIIWKLSPICLLNQIISQNC